MGLAHPPHPSQRAHHPRPPAERVQRRQQIRARLEPQRFLRDLSRHHQPRDLPGLTAAARQSASPGQLPQRPFHQLPQRARVGELLRHRSGLLDPAAERLLSRPELVIHQLGRRDPHIVSIGIQQEHQPRQPCLGGGVELQLGIRHFRLVPDRRAVPGTEHPYIDLASPHPFGAQLRRRLIRGGKVGHVHDHVPAGRNRPFDCGHVRRPLWKVPQLRGMRHEHSPPAGLTGTIEPSHAHPSSGQHLPPAGHPGCRSLRRRGTAANYSNDPYQPLA